ncbi:MAG: ATP-binding cassette domain-containing protein [Anaerococcus prevotii]|uniref:sulfate/molybdate ABC transporter ATP-binding protein n=1 Tax=Anaerococcus prevotii TaxID=33034 RepID=UPI0029035949|nr:ATP-binding cassette domain-containing protein [Anaerococcus prevotii]MDU2558073.1 ATP-binding cassette domain-containing protein [Anaerococcus prevotii]
MLVCKIRKNFKNFKLDVDFEMDNESLGLLGASGSGKSLTLKAIGGFIKPDSGKIILNGRTLFDSERKINLRPQDRRVGYLFQDYALFPNFTVEENVRAGLREKADITDKLKEMHIYDIKDKLPAYISGGERQRTALCRILVNKPDILLLDEPFSALDEFLKNSIEAEVLNIIRKYDLKTILVSHNKDEVYRISHKIISISNGKSGEKKETKDFFESPTTLTEAKLIGINNFSDFEIVKDEIFLKAWGIRLKTKTKTEANLCALRSRDIILSDRALNDNSMKIQDFRLIENIDSFLVILNQDYKKYDDLRVEIDKKDYKKFEGGPKYFAIDSRKLLFLKEE